MGIGKLRVASCVVASCELRVAHNFSRVKKKYGCRQRKKSRTEKNNINKNGRTSFNKNVKR